MAKNKENFDPRKFMEKAIEVMNSSVQEPRDDKVSPQVGAVLIKPDGSIETAYRGEYREGDHAEYTLLDRMNRNSKLDGSVLFVTLEPCAKGARNHPKMSCSERIVNARINKIWIGIEDPDPTVDRKGIKFLIHNGVEVKMFDPDLQKEIRESNKVFIEQAEERAKEAEKEKVEDVLTNKEKIEINAQLEDFSESLIIQFIDKAKLNVKYETEEFYRIFSKLGLIAKKNNIYLPTGIGLLLFGKRPQLTYSNALIRATIKSNQEEDIKTFEGPITNQAKEVIKWYKNNIGKHIDRSNAQRKNIYDYPENVFREAIINAVVHRDYDIEGSPILIEINDDAIIIKSPGGPVEPITFEQIKRFNAPVLSRNPKIVYVFDQLDLVEQRGIGFTTIKELPDKYDLPLPIVILEDPYLVVKFPRSVEAVRYISQQEGIENLSDSELKGYEWIRSKKEISTKDYQENFNVTQRTASRHLSIMLKMNLIKTNGEKPQSPQLKYISV